MAFRMGVSTAAMHRTDMVTASTGIPLIGAMDSARHMYAAQVPCISMGGKPSRGLPRLQHECAWIGGRRNGTCDPLLPAMGPEFKRVSRETRCRSEVASKQEVLQ